MAPIKLEDMPHECLAEVLEVLMLEEGQPSIASLALTNHRLRAICMHYLLRCITLRLPCEIGEFHLQVGRFIWLLWRYDAFSSVRRLVAGPWYLGWNALLDTMGVEPNDEAGTVEFDVANLNPFYGSADKNVFQNGELELNFDEDCAEKILLELLNRLPALKEFVSPVAPHPTLIKALEVKHPKCRLRVLDLDNDDAMNMDLVTSPSLQRISCDYSDAFIEDQPKCNMKSRVMAMIAGIAPSLEEVDMRSCSDGEPMFSSEEDENAHWESQGVPFAPHQMFREHAFPQRLGRLKKLHLRGWCHYPIRLDQWASVTDFTVLESLTLEIRSPGPDLGLLQAHGIFPALKSLSLRLHLEELGEPEVRDDELVVPESEYDEQQLMDILSGLPPLQSLRLTGYVWPEVLYQAVHVHCQSLEKLFLFPVSSEMEWEEGQVPASQFRRYECLPHETTLYILRKCPLLRELSIPIERSKKNAHDPAIYRAMGDKKRLTSVTLYMDCFSWSPPSREIFEAPGYFLKGNYNSRIKWLQNNLRACALDQELAWDIINTITGGRDTHVLQELRIRSSANARDTGVKYGDDLGNIVSFLARDYTFTKQPDGTMAVFETWGDPEVDSSSWAMKLFRRNWPSNASSETN
ncbi:unnamed protein product [Clonostachys rosea]|uniref:F-box domain-containing protein n=1 Tax=Bionectria ochroleuca TaxID=29856 RepID=A0ABY6UDL5_BIOOC|nr:unnamed protein product [Clonostachys rosea]